MLVVEDGTRGVELQPGDVARAIEQMRAAGVENGAECRPARVMKAVRRECEKFRDRRLSSPLFHAVLLAVLGFVRRREPSSARSMKYADLISLFADWRQFQKPRLVDGVPDYTPAAMAAQHRALAGYQQRLAAIDRETGLSRSRRTNHAVRAEMNGLASTTGSCGPGKGIRPSTSAWSPNESDQTGS